MYSLFTELKSILGMFFGIQRLTMGRTGTDNDEVLMGTVVLPRADDSDTAHSG